MRGKSTNQAFVVLEAMLALAILILCLGGTGALLLQNQKNIFAAQVADEDAWSAASALETEASGTVSESLDAYTMQITSHVGTASLAKLDIDWSGALQNQLCQIGQIEWGDAATVNMPWGFGPISSLAAQNEELFVTLSSTALKGDPTLLIFNLASSTNPALLGSLDNASSTVAGTNGLTVSGNYIYAASARAISGSPSFGQLQIIDISVPQAPRLVSTYKLPGVSGTSGQGIGNSIFYGQGLVYLGLTKTGSGPEFNIVDVRDPLHPILAGSFAIGNTINAIIVKDGFAYLAHPAGASGTYNEQLTVLNVSNPSEITRIDGFHAVDSQGNGESLWQKGYELFLGRTQTNTPNPELQILDVSNPTATLTPTGSIKISSSVNSLMAYDQKLFLLAGGQLKIFDISNPAQIKELRGSLDLPENSAGTSLACFGKNIYAASVTTHQGFISILIPP